MTIHIQHGRAPARATKVKLGKPQYGDRRAAVAPARPVWPERLEEIAAPARDSRAGTTGEERRFGRPRRVTPVAVAARREPAGASEERAMSAMLARGCGISDTLASFAQATDTPLDRLRRAQRLEALLAQLGPRARDARGAGKSPRTMRRTGAFITQLISSLHGDVCAAAQYLPAAAGDRRGNPIPGSGAQA
jgi:hypothetical protein